MKYFTNKTFDIFNQQSPVNCSILKVVSILLLLIFILSVAFNSFLLWIFIIYKEIRTSLNIYLIALLICNLVATFTEIPIAFINNLNCRYFII